MAIPCNLIRIYAESQSNSSIEGSRPGGREYLLRGCLRNTMRQREPELGLQELLDVWSANIGSLLDFDDFEDLVSSIRAALVSLVRSNTWIDRKRARCLAAISWYKASTASVLDISRYSLYMLCVPDRES